MMHLQIPRFSGERHAHVLVTITESKDDIRQEIISHRLDDLLSSCTADADATLRGCVHIDMVQTSRHGHNQSGSDRELHDFCSRHLVFDVEDDNVSSELEGAIDIVG